MLVLASLAGAQQIERVYNRDSQEEFKLKAMDVKTHVTGPIVRNRTVYTYENPFKKLTEASVWFGLDPGAVLGAFAYWYKNEYVPGVLMDKNKAWFIYTAITSRNRDPGIMEQYGPQNYHAQIYPLAVGYDLRVELLSVGFLQPSKLGLAIPEPDRPEKIAYTRKVYGVDFNNLVAGKDIPDAAAPKPFSVDMHAQRFKDGRIYVAGILRGPVDAYPSVKGLKDVYLINGAANAYNFVGWTRRPTDVHFKHGQFSKTMRVHGYDKGADAAQLWAHQRLVQGSFKKRRDALNFSMKYKVPSAVTALLAVPEEEMKLFRKKAAEWQKNNREQARREREWAAQRPQNWQNTGGGDPEIRVHFPNAERVYAVLPDGRVFDLKPSGNGYWGGSYDIPTTAGEGEYRVKVFAVNRDGSAQEQEVPYFVDRTAPEGTASADLEGDKLEITVHSEKGLANVTAFLPDGSEIRLTESETEAGVYKASVRVPSTTGEIRIVLLDMAHNRKELRCSW